MPSSRWSEGNHQLPPHKREYEDCKQILKLSPSHAARSRYSTPVCHDSTFVHQVSYQRFWENRWIPDSLPTSPRPRRKPTLVDTDPYHRQRHSSSCQSEFAKKTTFYYSLPLELKEKRSGDFRLFPPANFANSAILPTAKISAFFMQNFLPQKPKDSSL